MVAVPKRFPPLLVVLQAAIVQVRVEGAFISTGTSSSTMRNHAQVLKTRSSSSILFVSSREEQQSKSKSSPPTPDYGKTTIDIDQHRLEKITGSNKWRRPELFGSSLIDQTLEELSTNVEFQETAQKLQAVGQAGMSKEERTKRRRALDSLGVPPFNQFLYSQSKSKTESKAEQEVGKKLELDSANSKEIRLERKKTEVLQLNVGLYCNQACTHCHVESSPLRKTEMMDAETAAKCVSILNSTPSIHTLDITGGAPELNSNFRYIVQMARNLAREQGRKLDIIDRCNLTVLQEPGQEDLIDFLVENDVHVVASLPCYSSDNVDTQRGNGVFDRSISALLALNDAGYGRQNDINSSGGKTLKLDLVYNPLGAFLPPPQEMLEAKYKEELHNNYGIVFNSLYTMTNMPVKRFTDFLYKRGELKDYMDLLVRNYNGDTVEKLMCRNTISVGYDGKIFDCDFNQQLGYTIGAEDKLFEGGKTVFDISSLDDLSCDKIQNDNHCFGCTAGMGSS